MSVKEIFLSYILSGADTSQAVSRYLFLKLSNRSHLPTLLWHSFVKKVSNLNWNKLFKLNTYLINEKKIEEL